MGKKAIQVSGTLWQIISTVGWGCGAPKNSGLECIEGLPEGAVFRRAFFKNAFTMRSLDYFKAWLKLGEAPDVFFVFEHPDWPRIEPGEDLPILEVVWQKR